jgi:hypothetical protein
LAACGVNRGEAKEAHDLEESALTSGEESVGADPYVRSADQFQEPPTSLRATLRHLGPGIILVGAIVGSGEFIMTTKLGAEAGFVLLWFVLLSCIVKVIVQAELARFTISKSALGIVAHSVFHRASARSA